MTLDRIEEHWNAWTHYIGTLAAIAALVLLIIRAVHFSNVSYLGSVIVFGIALILLYSISGTYHILKPGKAKKIFHVLDHIGIYFLIAASYTPYIFIVLTGPKKWIIFGIQWGITLLGIFLKFFLQDDFNCFPPCCIWLWVGLLSLYFVIFIPVFLLCLSDSYWQAGLLIPWERFLSYWIKFVLPTLFGISLF